MSLAPLVAATDTDLASWQSDGQEFFLSAACAEVRKYCGWHIAPSVQVTGKRCWFGARNYVLLGSTYVTSVDQVTIDGAEMTADTDYFWDEPHGWLRRRPMLFSHDQYALVDFTHGYDEPPPDVKAVIFEVLSTAMELPASNATTVQTMQYSITLNTTSPMAGSGGAPGAGVMAGVVLSDQQKNRLGPYKLRGFGGLGH